MNSSENSGRQGAARPRWPYQAVLLGHCNRSSRREGAACRSGNPRNPFLVKSDHGFLASSENAVTSLCRP